MRAGLSTYAPNRQAIAKRVGEQTSLIALTTDAAHNMRLGTAYLRDRSIGSMLAPLALAAYNAGPNRVLEWLAANGDPRKGEVDMVDWMNSSRFRRRAITVQRVLENVVIYRAKRGEPMLLSDLSSPLPLTR